MKFNRWVVAVLTLGIAFAGGRDLSGQQPTIALRLECHGFGPMQPGIFRFTIANNGPAFTYVVLGPLLAGDSWIPVVRLLVKGSGKEADGIYGSGTLGRLRTTGAFAGRIDDFVVRLPPGTAYVIDLGADLFGRVKPRVKSGLPLPSQMSAIFEGRPISNNINSGYEYLRALKAWTGRLESPSFAFPLTARP